MNRNPDSNWKIDSMKKGQTAHFWAHVLSNQSIALCGVFQANENIHPGSGVIKNCRRCVAILERLHLGMDGIPVINSEMTPANSLSDPACMKLSALLSPGHPPEGEIRIYSPLNREVHFSVSSKLDGFIAGNAALVEALSAFVSAYRKDLGPGKFLVKEDGTCSYRSGRGGGCLERLTFDDCQNTAKSLGGTFLSTVYLGSMVNHWWRCARGHEWRATPNQIRLRTWCLECYRLDKPYRLSIRDLQADASKKGGSCHSTEYKGLEGSYEYECGKGHQFVETGFNVRHTNKWCPTCEGA